MTIPSRVERLQSRVEELEEALQREVEERDAFALQCAETAATAAYGRLARLRELLPTIEEAQHLLGYIDDSECPVCGSLASKLHRIVDADYDQTID